jgi:large subunit ribosomal protein L9
VTKGGFSIDRGQVPLDKAIKAIGLHEVKVVLHAEVRVRITLNVARTEDEAERQARGEDVLAEQTEEEEAAVAAEALFEEGAAPKPAEEGAAEE